MSLIAATRTTSGLKIPFQLDTRSYPKDGKVSDKEVAKLNLHRDQFHGEWNYEIHLRNAVSDDGISRRCLVQFLDEFAVGGVNEHGAFA